MEWQQVGGTANTRGLVDAVEERWDSFLMWVLFLWNHIEMWSSANTYLSVLLWLTFWQSTAWYSSTWSCGHSGGTFPSLSTLWYSYNLLTCYIWPMLSIALTFYGRYFLILQVLQNRTEAPIACWKGGAVGLKSISVSHCHLYLILFAWWLVPDW